MIKVLVIAPYPGLIKLINDLNKQLTDFEITVAQGDLTQSLDLLDKYKENKFDLIISRGGTANLIKMHTTIPVLNIQISGYDILRILTLLKGYQSTTIGVIGFKDVIKSFESVTNLMDININYIEVEHENQVEVTLKKAKKQGIRVIVGDTITVRLANEIGLQGVLITSGKESLLKTFEDAKQLYEELFKLNTKNNIYETVFKQLDDGIVVLNKSGKIKFANEKFYKTLNISLNECATYSLFEKLPFIQSILQFKMEDLDIAFQIAINNFDEIYEIKQQEITGEDGEVLHYIHFNHPTFKKNITGLQVIFSHKTKSDSPQHITSRFLFEKSIKNAKDRLKNNQVVCLIGEKGTGKRILIQLLNDYNANTVEININNISTRLFNHLVRLVKQIDANTIIHIRNIEKMTAAQQRRFIEQIQPWENKLIFSFTGEESSLINNDFKLNKSLHKLLTEDFIYLPPLRERRSDLEEFIQTFIIQFNEKFGKQIVGLKPNTLQEFLAHPWYGNLIELRDVLKQAVHIADGEYINEDALSILKQYNLSIDAQNRTYINLAQSLAKIEEDIIKIVLEEENMNQSKTAKRLDINRSTLWRKIKMMDEE